METAPGAEEIARRILARVLAQIRGQELVREHFAIDQDSLRIGSTKVRLPSGRVLVHGAGKAASSMATGVLDLLGDRVSGGLVIVKDEPDAQAPLLTVRSSHPHLDERSIVAGRQMIEAAQDCKPDDLVIFVLSGGASALMECPRDGIAVEDLQAWYREWLMAGYPIDELNRRRAEVSMLKAGGLSGFYGETPVVVLVMSDVKGNDMRTIGSGPLMGRQHVLVGDASTVRTAVADAAVEIGLDLLVNPDFLTGDANYISFDFTRSFLSVGEPTLAIPPNAPPGGRAQHLAMRCLPHLPPGSAFLAIGTDGSDGPTPYAGALVSQRHLCHDPSDAICNFDSTGYLKEAVALITTGATGSNLNDLYLFIRA